MSKPSLFEIYPCIVKWGRQLGSYDDYIKQQLELAEQDKAPRNAIYRQDDGTWATADDCREKVIRECLNDLVRNNPL